MLALGYPRFSYPGVGGSRARCNARAECSVTRLRRGPFKSRGPGWPAGRGEPSAPRASEELGAGAKVSSQLRPRAPPPPPPPPTPARGLGPALPRSPGPPPEAGPGRAGRRPQFHFGAWSLRRRPADPPAASPGPLASRPRPPVEGTAAPRPTHPRGWWWCSRAGPCPGATRGTAACPPHRPPTPDGGAAPG